MIDHPLKIYGAAACRVVKRAYRTVAAGEFRRGRDLFLFFQAAQPGFET
jgi:hypothetical protein